MINLQKAQFLRSAVYSKDFPKPGVSQIVFAGRSNVGKSSIINTLLNRKNLARTGQKPGKTIHVNLYQIDTNLIFSDLPGYGYARVSREEKERWSELMSLYFGQCGIDMKLGVLVFDARRDVGKEDLEMARLFVKLHTPFIICANKCDKLNKTELAAVPNKLASAFGISSDDVFPCSALSGAGRHELMTRILASCGE